MKSATKGKTQAKTAAIKNSVDCQCGEITGERCQWSGPISATVVLEHMPDYLRATYEAAGNYGVYPANGALRLRVEKSCAARLAEQRQAEEGDEEL